MEKLKVLIVDDEPEFAELVKMRLQDNGYDVITAINGKEGLAHIEAYAPDAVLLDVFMPGMDGLEVLKKIRKHNKDLPVFIVTAFSNEDRFKKAKQYNVSGFIVKTSDLKKEVANITNVIRVSRMYKGESGDKEREKKR